MKKLVSITLLVLAIAAQSCKSRKAEAVAVPEAVESAFNSKYPGVTDVDWMTENKDGKTLYDGDFKANGKRTEARFDENGGFIDEK